MKIIRNIVVQLLTGANVAIVLLLWTCCAATYLSPALHPRLSLVGLVFPFFLLGNLLFTLLWLLFKVRRLWLPLVGFAGCWGFVRDYCPVNWPSKVSSDSALCIITYNTLHFGGKDAIREDGVNVSKDFLIHSGADIICLQEAIKSSQHSDLFSEMEARGYASRSTKEFAVFSRLPILSSDTLALPGQPCFAQRVYLQDGADTILLLNQHLQSNKLSPSMKKAFRQALEQGESDSVRKELTPIVRLLTVASPVRAAQSDTLATLIEQWLPRRVIVCGDFNDTPISYTHRVLTRHLTSAYTQSGNGTGFTFHEKGFPVRIDHILFSGDYWQSCQTHVERRISCSDHFPVLTKLVKKTP